MDINVLLGIAGDVFGTMEKATKKLLVELLKEDSTEANVVQEEFTGNDLITRFELLEKLKISQSTLCNWQNKGLIKPIKIGRKVFFKLSEVQSIKGIKNSKGADIYNISRRKSN